MKTWMHKAMTLLISGALAAPALAQKPAEELHEPYDVPGLPHSRIWIPWVFAFAFAGACIAIAFKNPHRTHLD